MREYQIASFDGDQYFTSWSPDGTKFAFMSNTGGNWDVWTMNLDGTNLQQLTHEPSRDDAAAWSPDGKWLVFSSDRVHRVWPDLWLINPEHPETPERLTRGDGKYFFPTWSPDGTQIAYIFLPTGPPYLELRMMSFPGHVIRVLSKDGIIFSPPTWSPDGGKIAFASERTGNPELWVMDVSHQLETDVGPAAPPAALWQLTHHPAVDKDPSWSPDGRFIAFTSNRSGNEEIWVADVSALGTLPSGAEPPLQQLTHHPAIDHYPRWSPDGKRIAFTSTRSGHEAPWLIDLQP